MSPTIVKPWWEQVTYKPGDRVIADKWLDGGWHVIQQVSVDTYLIEKD